MLSALFAAYLFTQAPAAKVPTPPVSAPVAAKAEPLPHADDLEVQVMQMKADILGRVLKESEAYKAYQAGLADLGKQMDDFLAKQKAACFAVDQITRTRTPIAGCKAGK